jgi:replicative DNA helicase
MLATAEVSTVAMIGKTYSGAPVSAPEITCELDKFDFGADFQTKIATHAMRDLSFMRKVGHLIMPDYFENVGEAAVVNIALKYYKKYNDVPDARTAVELFKAAKKDNQIRGDVVDVATAAMRAVFDKGTGIGNSDSTADSVASFVRYQAMAAAILKSAEMLDGKLNKDEKFNKIEAVVKAAAAVGVNVDGGEYDYYEKITERTQERQDRTVAGAVPSGITTGNIQINDLLYHKGWGRRELSVIMGGAKSGKTTALIHFGKCGSLAGRNVLYVTCEVSGKILAERLDASISGIAVKALGTKIHEVEDVILKLPKHGELKIHEYPSGTLSPNMLRALIQRYKSPRLNKDGTVQPAIIFDMVVVDYADIMQPDFRTNDAIENSKNIWLGLRAIAFEENLAMLTATQTNREGNKSVVAKATDVAEDFNKIRTADIVISINTTDEERAAGESRLFFAASRNQESGFTIFIKQNLAMMRFITSIIRVE